MQKEKMISRFFVLALMFVLVSCKMDPDLNSNKYVWKLNDFQNGGAVIRAAIYQCPDRTWYSEEFMVRKKFPSFHFLGSDATSLWNEVERKVNTEYNKLGRSAMPTPIKYTAVFENIDSKLFVVKFVLIMREDEKTYITVDSKDQNWWFEATNQILIKNVLTNIRNSKNP